jgi:hypothetical protein
MPMEHCEDKLRLPEFRHTGKGTCEKDGTVAVLTP